MTYQPFVCIKDDLQDIWSAVLDADGVHGKIMTVCVAAIALPLLLPGRLLGIKYDPAAMAFGALCSVLALYIYFRG